MRERYLTKNEPLLVTGLMNDWRAFKDKITEDKRNDEVIEGGEE